MAGEAGGGRRNQGVRGEEEGRGKAGEWGGVMGSHGAGGEEVERGRTGTLRGWRWVGDFRVSGNPREEKHLNLRGKA